MRRKKQSGGYLRGPSHEQGGIPANVRGASPVELEGGEYIINAQTVNAVGTQFLDKLNSTQTSYHTGGFGSGQLPGSNYRKGGKVRRKLQTGGSTRQCIKHKMPDGTIMEGPTHGSGQTCVEWSNGGNKMRRKRQYGGMAGATAFGGPTTQAGKRRHRRRRKVRPPKHGSRMGGSVRKMQQGGHAHSQKPYFHAHHIASRHNHGGGPPADWDNLPANPGGGGGTSYGSPPGTLGGWQQTVYDTDDTPGVIDNSHWPYSGHVGVSTSGPGTHQHGLSTGPGNTQMGTQGGRKRGGARRRGGRVGNTRRMAHGGYHSPTTTRRGVGGNRGTGRRNAVPSGRRRNV